MKITTDNKPRVLVCWHDIPYEVRRDFEYIDNDDRYSERFVKYKGEWYDAHDTQRIGISSTHDFPMGWAMYVEPDDPLAQWHAILTVTFFSGIVFRFCDENGVIVGCYYT